MLLNTGPKPDGTINPPEKKVYQEIGKWLEKNGESIYNTTAGPYEPGPWGVSTKVDKRVYLHVLTDFADGVSKKIILPKIPFDIVNSYILSSNEKVKVVQDNSNLIVDLLNLSLDGIDAIVVIEVNGNVNDVKPIVTNPENNKVEFESVKASSNAKGRKSDVKNLLGGEHTQFSEGIHLKGWWSAERSDISPWVELTFSKQETINYVTITEQIRNCSVRKFVVEVAKSEDCDNWTKLYEGEQIGMDISVKVPETKAKKIRLRILETEKNVSPNISTFDVFKL